MSKIQKLGKNYFCSAPPRLGCHGRLSEDRPSIQNLNDLLAKRAFNTMLFHNSTMKIASAMERLAHGPEQWIIRPIPWYIALENSVVSEYPASFHEMMGNDKQVRLENSTSDDCG